MSLVTGQYGLIVQLNDGLTTGHLDDTTPQASQRLSISAAAGGSTIVLTTHPGVACGWQSLTWGGQELLHCNDHGSGLQCAFAFTETGAPLTWYPPVIFAPTEHGSQLDGANLDFCSSRSRYRGKNAAGNKATRVTNAAHWLPPGRQSPPIAVNNTILCDAPLTMTTEIGFDGNASILKNTCVLSVPTHPQWQAQKHSINAPWVVFVRDTIFTVYERCNPATGALVVVDPGVTNTGVQNTTEPYVLSSADGLYAVSMYMVPAEMGAHGLYNTHTGSLTCASTSAQVGQEFPDGVPPGDITYTSYMPFGTKATVIAALQQLHTLFS